MKTRKICLSLVLCLCALLSVFTLTGCGGSVVGDVQKSFAELDESYTKYAEVFQLGTLEDGLETKYVVNYGVDFANFSPTNQEKYDALKEKYNVMLALSSKYIDSNKAYVTALAEEDMTDETKNALKNLYTKIDSYIKYLPTFVEERNIFKNHFDNFSGNADANLAVLTKFKKSYGQLVNKNLDISLALANVIETTEIFDLLQSTEPTEKDTEIVKDYITTKMLPIFNQLLIEETETSFAYYDYSGGAISQIKTVVNNLEDKFSSFKTSLALSNATCKALGSKEKMQELFKNANDFFVEMQNYSTSVSELKIYDLVINNGNDFEEHKKQVPYAEIYFEKIDQFVSITLGSFMDNLASVVY